MSRIKLEDLIYVSFYKIPKELIKDERFEKMSIGAKLLYGVMIDRTELSKANGWINDDGEVFIYYKLDEIQQDLNISRPTGINYINELIENELVEKEVKDFNKPNKYYLLSIVKKLYHNSKETLPQKSKNFTTIVKKLDSNKNEYNKTEYNKTEYNNTVVSPRTTLKFKKPTIEEIDNYIKEKNYLVNAEDFYNFYESKNWMIGKNKMSKWKSAVATWNGKEQKRQKTTKSDNSKNQWNLLKSFYGGGNGK